MADHVPDYLKSHVIAGERIAFSLDEQAGNLIADLKPEGRSAATLIKEQGVSVVLMAMARGNRVAEHQAPGVVTIQVLRGRVAIAHGDNRVDAAAGALVTFSPNVKHSLDALDDSTILITVVSPEDVSSG
jgi:quercetin dioxygenase-like cupin family protein